MQLHANECKSGRNEFLTNRFWAGFQESLQKVHEWNKGLNRDCYYFIGFRVHLAKILANGVGRVLGNPRHFFLTLFAVCGYCMAGKLLLQV